MSAEDERARLIELETVQQDDLEALAAARSQVEKLVREIEQRDKATATRRADIAQSRRLLEQAQAVESSTDQALDVTTRRGQLEAKYRAIAADKVWFEYTQGKYAFQFIGACFLAAAERSIMGDEMGMGKTIQSIAALDLMGAKRVIVVAIPEVADGFAGEFLEFAPHRTVINLYNEGKMTKARRHELLDLATKLSEFVIVVNFEIWRRDVDTLRKLVEMRPDTVIVDEAHNMKDTASANFRSVSTLILANNTCPKCKGLIFGLTKMREGSKRADPTPCPSCGWMYGEPTGRRYTNPLDQYLSTKSVKNVIMTTGTPILNDPGDLFSLLTLADPILFKRKKSYLETFCVNNYHTSKYEFRPGGLEKLKPLIGGRMIARTLEQVGIDIPPQKVTVHAIDFDKAAYPLQYRTIQQLNKAAQIILESGEAMTIMHLIALITRKRQANVWPGGIELKDAEGDIIFRVGDEVRESIKMDIALENYIKPWLEAGHRITVFSQFTTALAEMQLRLEGEQIRSVRYDGSTAKVKRNEIKSNFYRARGEDAKWDVVLANYKTGGVGLNLTSATKTIILDEEWNPGKRNQAYARTRRIGQTEESEVVVLRIPASIDTWMANTIKRKEQMIEGFNEVVNLKDELKNAIQNGEI